MSGGIEDSDVIVIAPQTKNQDGSQTIYILDPCSSTEEFSEQPPDLGFISDLTAEVKNTGTIAVLSTNSDTGALELTLKSADKLSLENMEKSTSEELNKTINEELDAIGSMEAMVNDDDTTYPVKEEEEEVDVEEISVNDINGEHNSIEPIESDTLNNEIVQENLPSESVQEENEQDDDVDEGMLYIDEIKYTELQEELSQETVEDLKEFKVSVLEEMESAAKCDTETVAADSSETVETEKDGTSSHKVNKDNDSILQEAENVLMESKTLVENIDSSVKEIIEETSKRELHQENASNNENTSLNEEIIHGTHLITIPDGVSNNQEQTEEFEFVDTNTNTALTLLELAGGSSLKSVENVEIEVVEHDGTSGEFLSPQETQTELTTLTTLQPVPVAFQQESNVPEEEEAVEKSTEPVSCAASTPKPNVKCEEGRKSSARSAEQMIQQLAEGDKPGLTAKKSTDLRRLACLSSPNVSKREITEEILQKLPKPMYSEPPGGDVIFAMKLAHRLATKIVPSDKSDRSSTDNSDHESIQNSTPSKRKLANTSETSKTPQVQKQTAISDKELLKILEDDPDDPPIPEEKTPVAVHNESNTSQIEIKPVRRLEEIVPKVKMTKSRFPLMKLHPELEKELALKQLQGFGRAGKKRVNFVPEVVRKLSKRENETFVSQEHNNNRNGTDQTNSIKKRHSESSLNSVKRMKTEESEDETLTVDPNEITEKLSVEGKLLTEEQAREAKSIKQYSNKRLSRSSETPPRDVPMEILLNGEEDMDVPEDLNSSKNKIFKATNPRKRQEELKRKKQSHFANVLMRTKPQKKRGRPPKKKPVPTDDMINKEFMMKVLTEQGKQERESSEPSVSTEPTESSPKDDKPVKMKKMSEIDRLLGDEGAINMLYSVEQKRSGGEPKRGILPSYRRKKKDLQLKTKLVKSAVLRMTTSPPQDEKISLRGQSSKEDEQEDPNATALRKMSVDSRESLSSPVQETFSIPAKIVPAEASRIIRRHSSSSNYSSRSNSPRRLSVDGELASITTPVNTSVISGQGDTPAPSIGKPNKQTTPTIITAVKKSVRLTQEKLRESLNRQLKTETEKKTSVTAKYKAKVQTTPNSEESPAKKLGRPRKVPFPTAVLKKCTADLNSSLADVLKDFTKEMENANRHIPPPPVETPKKRASTTNMSRAAAYKKSLDQALKTSVVYKEIMLKRHNHVVEIILSPVSTKLKNAMNINVLRELTVVLNGLTKDSNCRVVLITSSDDVFCQGVDFLDLIQEASKDRVSAALDMANAIHELVKTLAMFSRPVIAGVRGHCMGLGVSLVALCDMVCAAPAASFHTPYARLGHSPEGAATLTFPSLLGARATSELLFACKKLSAEEALSFGLVTRILDSSRENFQEELLDISMTMATQSPQSMEATKALLRHSLVTSLETTLVSETHLLVQHWSSDECQAKFRLYQDQQSELTS